MGDGTSDNASDVAMTFTGTDSNVGDALTYSLTTALTGMTINASTVVISWTSSNAEVGGPWLSVAGPHHGPDIHGG